MTQALSISMLMLGADSTLKPDTTATSSPEQGTIQLSNDTELSAQGSGFSAVLNGMVQTATTGKNTAGQRQLIAAGGGLSALTTAMLQATDSTDAVAESDLALANNLLLQIAFSSQNVDAEADPTQQDGTDTAALLLADESVVDGDSPVHVGVVINGDTTDEPLSKAVVTTDRANIELITKTRQSSSVPEEVIAKPVANTDAAGGDVDGQAETKLVLTDSNTVAAAAGNTESVTAEGTAALNSKPDTDAAVPREAGSGPKQQPDLTTNQARVTDTAISNLQTAEVALNAELIKAAGKTEQAKDGQPEVKTGTSLEDKDIQPEIKTAISVQAMTGTKADVQAAVSSSGAVAAMVSTTAANSDSSKAEAKKGATNIVIEAGAAVKADTAAGIKAGTQEQGAQQQQHQQQHQQQANLAQIERQLAAVEPGAANSKATAETSLSRSEHSFAASLQAAENRQQTQAGKAAVKTAAEQLKQAINLQQHDAAGQLRERVNLMVRQNIQIAEIRLDPAGLGQMQIKVDMQQDQTNVQFIVQQPQAKELLEQQLPRLREMLQQQGLVLGEGSVQQQSQQERQLNERQQQQHGQTKHGHAENATEDELTPVQLKVAASDRLVDYYA